MPDEKLSKSSQIWKSQVQPSDIDEALDYATISLPWTFDRMGYGPVSQRSVNDRLFHIMIGVLNQTILARVLTEKGYTCKADWTGYRESDVFDFLVNEKVYDVKTSMLYAEYDSKVSRDTFSPELVIANRSYPGPEWRHFFPVGVPITQLTVDKKKDAYIFGIALAKQDLRKTEPVRGDDGFWCAVPFNEAHDSNRAHDFLQKTPVIRCRENEGKGFFAKVAWRRTLGRLFPESRSAVQITLYGEWDGKPCPETLSLREGETRRSRQEFSSISCIRVDQPAVFDSYDRLDLSVVNRMDAFVQKGKNPDVNLNDPNFVWKLEKPSFVNLRIPKDYRVYWLGYISFLDFSAKFQTYPAWFVPHPKTGERINTPGRPMPKLRDKLAALDRRRAKAIQDGKEVPWPEFTKLLTQNSVRAGMLIAARRGNMVLGAACYYYPPHGFYETALYVLPKDLWPMDTLD